MIKIINGVKAFKTDKGFIRALNRVNIEINKSEMVAIMGASGSGKSTLLNIIAGYDKLSNGQYFYKGVDIDEQDLNRIQREDIGMIFQDYQLFDFLNVYDNIICGCYYGKRKLDKVFLNLICQQLKIEELLDKRIKDLSGGEKQRVAIARLLLANKSIILADEPTGALDEKNRDKIIQILKELSNKGKTVIIVTHDNYVATKCDRIIRLEKGYAS